MAKLKTSQIARIDTKKLVKICVIRGETKTPQIARIAAKKLVKMCAIRGKTKTPQIARINTKKLVKICAIRGKKFQINMEETNLIYKEEYYKVVGLCMEVHRILGGGLLEIVYKDALEYEFK